MDPATDTAVIFLSNRVHPDGGGNVTALRGRVATLAAEAVMPLSGGATARGTTHRDAVVATGIDVLREEEFERLRGARVGLLTNQTGRAQDGMTTIDLLDASPDVDLRVLFSPEHGIRGDVDTVVEDATDLQTGLLIYSLYGQARRPTTRMLDAVDVIVVDLQTAGARFYTYSTTMAYVMEAAAARGVKVMVLDRPNPITGMAVEGPLLDEAAFGFTGLLVDACALRTHPRGTGTPVQSRT